MILRRISLHPFAGFVDLDIPFSPGLNVVCGPNDIGKSTLFRAIESALLLETRLRASTTEGKSLKRLIPIGGDHAQVALELEAGGKSFRLEKTWGAGAATRLVLSDGTSLTTPEKIEERLRELLPTPPATFRSVLFAGQNMLEGTVAELERNQESIHSLGDVLRLAINGNDGISVDRLKAAHSEQLERAFLNWEPETQGPKRGRGVENPWDRQGSILRAYYAKERLRKLLVETQALEAELGDKSRVLGEKLARQAEGREFVRKNETIVEAIAVRQGLHLRLDQAERDAASLARDLNAWLQAESDRKTHEPEVARLDSLAQTLGQELKEARAEQGRRAFLARYEKVERARTQLDEARAALSVLPAVTAEDLTRLRGGWNTIQTLKASLSAAKLQVNFLAKSAMGIAVKKDFDPERKETVLGGATFQIQAGGRIQIAGQTFELTVTSGDGNLDKVEAQLKRESEGLRQLLTQLSVRSLEEAQDRHERWSAAAQSVRTCENSLKMLLEGETLEQLQLRHQAARSERGSRDPELIQKDYEFTHSQLSSRKGELASAAKSVVELQRRHGCAESSQLTSLMVKKGVEQETLKTQLAGLPPLPDDIGDVGAYLAKFKRHQSELPLLAEETRTVSNIVVEIKTKMPEQSAQDFDRQHREASASFERELKRGRSLQRVGAAMQAIDTQGGDLYHEFRGHLHELVGQLSAGKYGSTRSTGALPSEYVRQDGTLVPYSWLSSGTKDAFALSLRLAMARYFLRDARGFMLMDDPLVAMDPDRQRVAAELLRGFAAQVQLIIFTCHPVHAELLGGNRLSL